jgi:hypothetical protein
MIFLFYILGFIMTNHMFSRAITMLAVTLIILPAQASDQHEEHEQSNAKGVAAFHAALSPLWHAPVSPTRIDNACKQAAKLEKLANDINGANAADLQEVSRLFKEKCQNSPQEAATLFGKLHDAFHRVSDHKH